MKTLALTQGSAAWHAHRATARNASEAAAALGCSPLMTRTELLRALHTGIRPEPTQEQSRLFADGHAIEAAQRPGAEYVIGEPLYPVVGCEVVDGIELSASFDGLTMDESTAYECKTLNDDLRALPIYGIEGVGIRASDLPKHYRVQMEQQLMVSGADRVLFVAANIGGNDVRRCWYESDPSLRAEILAGWRQFDADLAAYVPAEVLDRPAPVGHGPDQLPALRSTVKGELVLESNIKEWEAAALAYIKSVRDHDLKTDEDFANADAAAKWCDASKTSLEGVRAQLMGATGDVNLAVGTLDRIMGELDKTRIAFNNAIKARKDARKSEIVAGGIASFREHIAGLNTRLGRPYMPNIPADFAGAIKGKSSLAKMEDAVANTLVTLKIESNRVADGIQTNLNWLREHAKDHTALFPDTGTIVLKAHDDLVVLAKLRIAEHLAAEAKKAEDLRAKIQAEEKEKAEKAAREKVEAEQRQAAAATPAPTAAPAQPLAAAPIAQPAPASPQRYIMGGMPDADYAPRHEPQAANVVPIQRPAPIEKPTLTLGEINARLGLTMTSAFVRQLGIAGTPGERGVVRYRESEFGLICEALVAHVRTVQHQQLQAA